VGKEESVADKYAKKVEDVLEKAKRNKDMRDREREEERKEDLAVRRELEREEADEVARVEVMLKDKRRGEREEGEKEMMKKIEREREVEREIERKRKEERGEGGDEKMTTGIGGSWDAEDSPEADYKPARGSWGGEVGRERGARAKRQQHNAKYSCEPFVRSPCSRSSTHRSFRTSQGHKQGLRWWKTRW